MKLVRKSWIYGYPEGYMHTARIQNLQFARSCGKMMRQKSYFLFLLLWYQPLAVAFRGQTSSHSSTDYLAGYSSFHIPHCIDHVAVIKYLLRAIYRKIIIKFFFSVSCIIKQNHISFLMSFVLISKWELWKIIF